MALLAASAVIAPVSFAALSAGDQTTLTNTAAVYMGTGASGMNILSQASVPGALGDGISVADVEGSWNMTHEDLVRTTPTDKGAFDAWYPYPNGLQHPATLPSPRPSTPADDSHGTAVASIIVGKRDGNGVDGIAPDADFHAVSDINSTLTNPLTDGSVPSPAANDENAIYSAGARLAPGSVIVIERAGNSYDGPLEGEFPTFVKAIQWATAKGIIVVEAAGNGNVNLDTDPHFTNSSVGPGVTSTSPNFSGAIIVGAGGGCSGDVPRGRTSFSSYGARVDVQGPGWCVASAASGYGAAPGSTPIFGDEFGTTPNTSYSDNFAGTSSATAVIGGFVAALSGAYTAATGKPLTPALARATLMNPAYGQPQVTSATNPSARDGHIGPLPDLGKAIAAIATRDTTPPTAPTTISGSDQGPVVSLVWHGATDDTGVDHFDIYRNGQPYDEVGGSTGSSIWLDPKAPQGSTVGYDVYAVDAAGNRSPAIHKDVVVPPVAPTVPTNVTVTSDSTNPTTSLDVSWTASTDDVGVTQYQIRRDGLFVGSRTSGTTFTDNGLAPGSIHHYSVVAVDGEGNRSAPSVPRGGVTTSTWDAYDKTAPQAPSSIVLSAPGSGNAVNVVWTAALDNVGVTSYDVYRSTGGGSDVLVDETAGTNWYDGSVAPSTAYTYKVVAVDAAGNRSPSKSGTVTTGAFTASTDVIPPTAAGPATMTLSSSGKPVITYTAASDNVGVAGYAIYRNGLFVISTTALSWTDPRPTTGQSATYTVVPYDAAGNRGPSDAPGSITATS